MQEQDDARVRRNVPHDFCFNAVDREIGNQCMCNARAVVRRVPGFKDDTQSLEPLGERLEPLHLEPDVIQHPALGGHDRPWRLAEVQVDAR